MKRQAVSFEVLVFIILAAAMAVFAVVLGLVVNSSSESAADQSCFSAVVTRALGTQVSPALNTPLTACRTRVYQFSTESEREMRNTIAADLLWCRASFDPAGDTRIVGGTNRFCHVCAIYYDEQGRAVEGVWERAQQIGGSRQVSIDSELEQAFNVDPSLQVPDSLVIGLAEPVVILYVQDRVETFNGLFHQLITGGRSGMRGAVAGGLGSAGATAVAVWLFPPAGAIATAGVGMVGAAVVGTSTVAGGVLGFSVGKLWGPDVDGFSGILITQYDEQTITNMGCTRLD